MAGLRKGHCYTNIKRPYTRKSKFQKKGFIKSVPNSKVVRFEMGDPKKQYNTKVMLVSKQDIQIRHNAIESARQIINRNLTNKLGQNNYFFQVHMVPHHILRENKMLGGAHADRLQTGMAHAFGKPVGLASQVKTGKVMFSVNVNAENIESAKESLLKATPRLPGRATIEIIKNQVKAASS
ncbi:MAG: 50S ribosomal protein L16 [Nanoarchaeota archaeon]